MGYREDKPSLPSHGHHNATGSPTSSSFSSTPSKRRLASIILALGTVFVLYSITSSSSTDTIPSTNSLLHSGSASDVNSDSTLRNGNGGLFHSGSIDTTTNQHSGNTHWSSWRPWSSWSESLTSGGRHDSAKSPLSAGLTNSASPAEWESPTRPLPLDATLEERLTSWETSPLPEPGEWVQFNLQTCPDSKIGKNANYDLLRKAHLLWASMNSTHIGDKRSELINYLRDAETAGLLAPANWGSGRGLVFTAGNADTFVRVLLTIRMLREHMKCDLPAEIFSFPGEEADPSTKEELKGLNATLRIIEGAVRDKKRTKNFHIKASAIVQSSFREPLYLDSDNLPAVLEEGAFEALWDSKGYQKLGMMAWPDYWKTAADIPIWLLIGTQCRDEWEQEAGQILVDKSKHMDMLLLSEYMLKDWQYWFNLSDGDKDIFRYAMLALRKRWAVPGRYLGAGGLSWNTQSGYCGHTMLQHDAAGRPLFVHMNLLKQIPSGISRGTTFKRTRSVSIGVDDSELMDWGVEADMLANAAYDGKAIIPAPDVVRRRAAIERGLRPFLHGGSVSAVCADIEWHDPRTEKDMARVEAEWYTRHSEAIMAGDEDSLEKDFSFTLGDDGFRVDWENPVETLQWNDDPRLKPFEDRFFDMGGRTSGEGF